MSKHHHQHHHHHHAEESKTAELHHEATHKFLNLFAEIKGFPQTQHDLCDSLLTKRGVLPHMEITASPHLTGTMASNRDLADAGVVRKQSVEKNGTHTTTVDYGNGVVISSIDGNKPVDLGHCHTITFKNNMAISALPPNHLKLNGNVEDPKGRIIAKHNDDGSYTVDTGKGFFTQRSDGTIRKETAIRTDKPHERRKFHDFDVIDTETPLGGLKPSDMSHH